uniref:non-specific serine/threonine protein kinase n=1 Tax=Eubacterium cellulosolvens (strain ATCC 43171 / JCM 9499 / 6) TaxID=633697 RepID=I5AXF2_EUBC6
MIICKHCHKEFDENVAMGVCPACGTVYEEEETIGEVGGTMSIWDDPISEGNQVIESDPFQNDTSKKEKEDPRWLQKGVMLKNRYMVEKVIGAGGFGITYKVLDKKTNTHKALKEYFQQGVVNRIPGTTEILVSTPKRREEFEYGRARLLNEAQIVAKFQSSSIVRVEDYFEENNTAYMIMEYLDYTTLEDFMIQNKRPLTSDEAINIGVKLCDALEELHEKGVIHRDISPDNIFINPEGKVKIIDFGSARLSKEDTDDRLIVLKPGFAPPEQYEKIDPKNDKQQAWTDIYALGATLYLALTGIVPAEASDRKADFDNNQDRVCYPHEINQNIPEFLSNTIMTAMAINIHERFKNATELKQALLQERKVHPVEVARKNKKIKRAIGIAACFVAVMLAVLGGVRWFGVKREQAVLKSASISFWYVLDGSEDVQKQKTDAMNDIVEQIRQSDRFSEVKIDVKAIPKAEYAAELNKAEKEGKMPSVFESPEEKATYMKDASPVKKVVDLISADDCYFIKDYRKVYEEGKRIPTGFKIPVVYINLRTISDRADKIKIEKLEDLYALDKGEMANKPVILNKADTDLFKESFSDFEDYADTFSSEDVQTFLDGDAAALLSDTDDYLRVRSSLPGYFAMIPISTSRVTCSFENYWSLADGQSENQRAASQEVLAYLLSNYAQDRLYLQTDNGGLPIDKAGLEAYSDVRHAFSGVLKKKDSITFKEDR